MKCTSYSSKNRDESKRKKQKEKQKKRPTIRISQNPLITTVKDTEMARHSDEHIVIKLDINNNPNKTKHVSESVDTCRAAIFQSEKPELEKLIKYVT